MELTSKQRAQLRGMASTLDTIVHVGTNMKEIAGWCDAHKIPFATKFKYRKDFPLKANIWNLYSYFRFLYTRKIVLEK